MASSKAAEAIKPGDPLELDRVAGEVVPPAPAPAAGGAPAPGEPADVLIDNFEMLAADPSALADLTEDELAAVFELAFGLVADYRGPHWEMPADGRAAQRLAKWVKKSVERHGGLGWLEKWFPDVMALVLLAFEVSRRYAKDRELAGPSTAAQAAAA